MAHKKHKEVIEAWLNGAQVQYKTRAGEWEDSEEDQPGFFGHLEYRIKPAEPERVYPLTQMTMDELRNLTEKYAYDNLLVNICNAALRHACDAGQIVTREEFDRAVGDRKARDMAVAKEVQISAASKTDGAWDSVLESMVACEVYRRIKEDLNLDDIVSRIK